ncbi:hypothetical protein [Aeoliella mucimassa]|uniref:LysM domain-containing protein n=1 Tax=Aeoliella mucimassa TaxID=2527972 RepID=A0A518AH62_9BACT|nr:hypothetical protein [Aeoliella mucimassa]QDU54075.1 hypothetical protein Pan181_02550 [Aeoliella mucimassa]
MTRSTIATLALVAVVASASASSAFAGCGGGKKYYGGASNLHHRYISSHNHGVYKQPVVVHQPVVIEKKVIVEKPAHPCCHPNYCMTYVHPGDTWATLCERAYGRTDVWNQVVTYNNMQPSAPLTVGQPIQLPTFSANGQVVASSAPMPPMPAFMAQPGQPQFQGQPFAGQPQAPAPQFNGQPQAPQFNGQPQGPIAPQAGPAPSMNIRPAQPKLPTFNAGSSLVLDGSSFGSTPGQVQLMVGPMALPVAIAEWNANEVAIQLPELPLTTAADARLIVLDASGKVVNESGIRLAPKTNRLAMGN